MLKWDQAVKLCILWPLMVCLHANCLIAIPCISRIEPTISHACGGKVVTIEGIGFTNVTTVNFGDQPATFNLNSDSLITATIPPHTPQVVPITLVTADGKSEITQEAYFTYRGELWAFEANHDQNTVTAFDPTTQETLESISLKGKPHAMAMATDGTKLVVTLEDENEKVIIDTARLCILPDANPNISTLPISEQSLFVKMPAQPPFAKFSYQLAASDSTILFDAAESVSPVGAIVDYAWNFGDGETVKTSEPSVSHHYLQQGTYSVTLSMTNAAGLSCLRSIEVVTSEISEDVDITRINSSAYISGRIGESFKYVISTTSPAVSYDANGLPPGLSLNSITGEITGIPTTSGIFSAILFAIYADGTDVKPLTVSIIKCEVPILTPETFTEGLENHHYTTTIEASGVLPPFIFGVHSGNLPPGLFLNQTTGVLSGTPKQSGTFHFTISATDQQQCVGVRAYTLIINAVVVCPAPRFVAKPLGVGVMGQFYSEIISIAGGKPPITFSTKTRKLPSRIEIGCDIWNNFRNSHGSGNLFFYRHSEKPVRKSCDAPLCHYHKIILQFICF